MLINSSTMADHVGIAQFEQILNQCNVSTSDNAFCRFLLLTCSTFSSGETMVDYRQFFNSVF